MNLPGSISLCTRTGREIPNAQDPDAAPYEVERWRALHRKSFATASERRPPTGQYNCHGLTFANRRTGIYDPLDVQAILKDDGFRRVRLSEVQPGDIAVYHDGGEIEHTGIVLEVVEGYPEGSNLRAARVLSKWGQAGEYTHMAGDAPYSKQHLTYLTDRP